MHQRRQARSAAIGVAAAAVAVTMLAACTSGSDGGRPSASDSPSAISSAPSAPATTQVVRPASITASPSSENPIAPAEPVGVTIKNGTFTTVSLVSSSGKKVDGAMSADKTSWHSTEKLGYGKTYKLTAAGANAAGRVVTEKTTVETVEPDTFTMPQITDAYGSSIGKGNTYGVGMLVRVHFDEAVSRKKAERTLSVTTTPKVTGGWYWSDDQNAWWRPKQYYPSKTKVAVKVNAYGAKLGKGLYGQADKSAAFTIGQKRMSIASGKKHNVKVYFDGKLVRTMKTSMGKGGYDPVNPSVNFWTMKGNYTVLNHENPAIMSSSTFGVKKGSPNYYDKLRIPYGTKISTDGIYLHQLNSTANQQGHVNVTHGCLNLVTKNAKWFYDHSRVGDVVKLVKTGGPTISFNQGGQWSMSWSDWAKGSALS